jgi:hypothetical protein
MSYSAAAPKGRVLLAYSGGLGELDRARFAVYSEFEV